MASLFDVMDSSEENDESARDESISGESVNGENRSDEGRNDVVPVNEQPVASLVSSNPQNILTPVVDTNAIASEVALMLKNNHLKIDLFMVVIALLLPFMGFLIYACNVGSSPKSARKIMIVSLVGAALYVLGYVIYYGVTYGF